MITCITIMFGPPIDAEVKQCNCSGTGGNCLATVVISASYQKTLDNFINSVENDDATSFFSGKDYKKLFGDVQDFQNYIDGLRNGTLKFTILPPDAEDEITFAALHDSQVIVTPDNAGSNAIVVIPITVKS